MEKLAFTAANIAELDVLLQEQLEKVTDNIQDERYEATAKREVVLRVVIEPDSERNVKRLYLFADCRLGKRLGKPMMASIQGDQLVVYRDAEQTELELRGDNVRPIGGDRR